MPILTLIVIGICVAVGIYSRLGDAPEALKPLLISNYVHQWQTGLSANAFTEEAGRVGFLPEVRAGQVWRLVTPIFIHFTIIHILFNLMMFRDLGTFVETRFGPRYLAIQILAFGILSNVGQALWGSPFFGGMSGVVYALLGFMWIRGRFDPNAGWELNKSTVQMMLIWYVLCFTGLIGNIANTAHTVGLLAGHGLGLHLFRAFRPPQLTQLRALGAGSRTSSPAAARLAYFEPPCASSMISASLSAASRLIEVSARSVSFRSVSASSSRFC
jgi:GlpG protein